MRHHALMLTLVACISCVASAAEIQPVFQSPDMVRAMDDISRAFRTAVKDADRGDMTALRESLARLNDRWSPFYKTYAEIRPMDAAWKADLTTIDGKLLEIVNETARVNSTPTLAPKIKAAADTFEALRSRSGIPDLMASLETFRDALDEMGTVAKTMKKRGASPEEVAALQAPLAAATDAWTEFVAAVFATNALGLDSTRQEGLHGFANTITAALETLNSAVANQDRQEIVSALSKSNAPLGRIMLLVGGTANALEQNE